MNNEFINYYHFYTNKTRFITINTKNNSLHKVASSISLSTNCEKVLILNDSMSADISIAYIHAMQPRPKHLKHNSHNQQNLQTYMDSIPYGHSW